MAEDDALDRYTTSLLTIQKELTSSQILCRVQQTRIELLETRLEHTQAQLQRAQQKLDWADIVWGSVIMCMIIWAVAKGMAAIVTAALGLIECQLPAPWISQQSFWISLPVATGLSIYLMVWLFLWAKSKDN